MESIFWEKYPVLKESIVAIVARASTNPEFPDIVGTGFIVREDGWIMTCKHVLAAFQMLPRLKEWSSTESAAAVLLLRYIPGEGMMAVPLDIVATAHYESPQMDQYLPDTTPDISLLRVNVTGLPTLQFLETAEYLEGKSVFLSGFPMGTRLLRAPGRLHQATPTLQRGIISAVLPHQSVRPHALLLDCLTEGGASGSPVFDEETGDTIGMVRAGLFNALQTQSDRGPLTYRVPTAHTLAVPGYVLGDIVDRIGNDPAVSEHQLPPPISLLQLIEDARRHGRIFDELPRADGQISN